MEVETIFDDAKLMAVLSRLQLGHDFGGQYKKTIPERTMNSWTELKKYKCGGSNVGTRWHQERSQTQKPSYGKKVRKNFQPERRRYRREMDHPKTHPYRFHEYHPLKITLEKVFMQIGDKDEEKRD